MHLQLNKATLHCSALFAVIGMASTGCVEIGAGEDPALINAEHGSHIRAKQVCFTVHNPGDTAASTVRGTLYHTGDYDASSRALLLLHGAVNESSTWNGAWPWVWGAPSAVRDLVKDGHGVFAIDRLGYGRSTYSGSGWSLTPETYIETTHEIVTQIRDGSFKQGTFGCWSRAAHGAAGVVLIGHSAGAAEAEAYSMRYHDIDGVVGMAFSNNGASSLLNELFVNIVIPQFNEGKDYVHFFTPDENGYSQLCEDTLFYPEGMDPDVLEQLCSTDYFADPAERTSPSGELAGLAGLMEHNRTNIANVGPTPAMLIFYDRDAFFTNADFHGESGTEPDVVTPEIQMWQSQCNCDVTVYFQNNSGHDGRLHEDANDATDRILDWLEEI